MTAATRRGRASDLLVALFVVACVCTLVFPLPTELLDILLVVNMSVALLLLLVVLYLPNALALLSFPALLLLTTLFRLGLNVASTRLILSQADAGEVIRSFGSFLIGGQVLVGIIVFAVITIVNLVVIARGASRISEVAARFMLDALPGKQVAIDADLRAGLISATEAREKREELRKESQLYGAMDGAMRFVQGDAIAGLLIIGVNIVGGLSIGLTQGMPLTTAIQTYTILTVGDGLVNVIPSLFIAFCSGIVVTRVASGDRGSLGAEVTEELLARTGPLRVSGVILLALGALPGLPLIPFLIVGLTLLAVSIFVVPKRIALAGDGSANSGPAVRSELPGGTLLLDRTGADRPRLELVIDAAILGSLLRDSERRYRERWAKVQEDAARSLGIALPPLELRLDDTLPGGGYSVMLRDVPLLSGAIPIDAVFVETLPEVARAIGLESLSEVPHPVTGVSGSWMPDSQTLRAIAEAGDIQVLDAIEFIYLSLYAFFVAHPEEVFSIADMHARLRRVEEQYPGLLGGVVAGEFVGVARLTEVAHELIRTGGSLVQFEQFLQAIGGAVSLAREEGREAGAQSCTVGELLQAVRTRMRRQIVKRFLTNESRLRVIRVGPWLADELAACPEPDAGGRVRLPAAVERLAITRLRELLAGFFRKGVWPFVILAPRNAFLQVNAIVRRVHTGVTVLSWEELPPEVEVEELASWDADAVEQQVAG